MNLQIHSDTTEVFCSHFNWFAPLHNPISKNLVFFLSDVFEGRGPWERLAEIFPRLVSVLSAAASLALVSVLSAKK